MFKETREMKRDLPASSTEWLKMVPRAMAEGLTGGRSVMNQLRYNWGRVEGIEVPPGMA
jgi:hypothetical protein